MDKSAIRNFSIEARKILMKSAETEAGFYGVTRKGCKNPIQKGNDFEVYETLAGTENRIYGVDIKRRANLVEAVETLGFDQVIEETAYTWFNRIIAIRFMEVNGYLPTRVRVLSSETGSNTPDIVTQSLDVDLNMIPEELEKVQKAKDENRYDDAFRMLFVKQCNELNAILPGLFEKTDDYMELLLKLSYTSDGVVRMLVDTVAEDNFNVETEGQVEIIGWMYQYYNTELKDDTFAQLKKNVKITKERIPAATQLFTPDWIVRYMVENSVGRVWIEHLRAVDSSIDEKAKAEEFGWKYYLPEAEQEEGVRQKLVEIRKDYLGLEPKDITCIDPCMGSGHILVYMFDILMDIYRSEGYSERDAAFSILENNIRGLDIDRRAYQLSYFALMMKARGYNRLFFRGIQNKDGKRIIFEPKVFFIEESNEVHREHISYFGLNLDGSKKEKAMKQVNKLLDSLVDAKEYGSILDIEKYDWDLMDEFISQVELEGQISFEILEIDKTKDKIKKLIDQSKVMSNKYWAVSTNPPYMGNKGMNNKLSSYIQKRFPDAKTDIFACFISKGMELLCPRGINAQVTMQVWMFLTAFDRFRQKIFSESHIVSLLHMDNMVMGIAFGTSATIFRKGYFDNYEAVYSYTQVSDLNEYGEPITFPVINERYSSAKISDFEKIPRIPIAYWASENNINSYVNNSPLSRYADVKKGMSTADDNRFIRMWHEVEKNKFQKYASYESAKWFCLNKGGAFRRWYGNNDFIVNWENNGREMKEFKNSVIRNEDYYFRDQALTWTYVTNYKLNVRYYENAAFAAVGPGIFPKNLPLEYILGILNSEIAQKFADNVGGETITYEVGEVASIPIVVSTEQNMQTIISLVKENINFVKKDWDFYENSWDFKKHPLLENNCSLLSETVALWKSECANAFNKVLNNEQIINKVVATIYNMSDELTNEIPDKDISIRIPTDKEAIQTLISYAVGCMFGRYSLDVEGLVFAGGNFDSTQYRTFLPDVDGIIPISDTEYFKDDIVNRFEEFLILVFGKDTIDENLQFVAKSIGAKGGTPRDIIRNYFINEFYKDHCNMYSVTGSGKRPLYWMFDSGKQNGFKCLIYIHRYSKDTLNLIRSEYLHKTEDAIENALKNVDYILQTSTSAVEKAKATKDRDKYVKQLNEMRIYYQALSHLAIQKIEIDLDNGVKNNYQLFQDIEVIIDGGKKQKVDLLAKI